MADESPSRPIEDGLGLGLVVEEEEEFPSQEESKASEGEGVGAENVAAVVDSEGIEFGGSEVEADGLGIDGGGVELEESGLVVDGAEAERNEDTQFVAGSEIEIGEGDEKDLGNESELVKVEEDLRSSDVGVGSGSQSELDVDKLDSDVKLETMVVEATEDDHMNDVVDDKVEFENNCCDLEKIGEFSKTGEEEESGEENSAGKADLCGTVSEDCHMEDAVDEKGEGLKKNMSEEGFEVVTAFGNMEQIDQSIVKEKEEGRDENVARDTDLIGMSAEDCQMNSAVEEKGEEFEKNMAAEKLAASDTDRTDDCMNIMKEEKVVGENVAGKSDLIGMVKEGSHLNDGAEEKGGEFEKSLAMDQCVIKADIGDVDQIDESENTSKEKEVIDNIAVGNFDLTGMILKDSHMNDTVEEKGDEFEKNLPAEQCAIMDTAGDMDQIDDSGNMLKEDEAGEENVAGDSEMIGVELIADQIDKSDNIENQGGDGDKNMESEEENVENKEELEENLSAAPDDVFSLHNVEPDHTTGDDVEDFIDGEEPVLADAEIGTHIDTPDAEKSNTKPKRGRKPSKVALTKKTEEDVCFICFDGGDLVVCDRRGCPKVYHPSCVNRDEAFFQAKGRWNCGWHLCSKCEKNAQYMCLTCTFSLCKGCIKDTDFYSVRGNKGFCQTCFKTVNMIESKEQGNNEEKINFDDKTCWESLFKDYWMDMKKNLQLTPEELALAKSPCKGSDVVTSKQKSADEACNVNNIADSGSNNSSGNVIAATPKRKKSKRLTKSVAKVEDSPSDSDSSGDGNKSKRRKTKKPATPLRKRGLSRNNGEGGIVPGSKWASPELLKFVMHMRNGVASVLTQFEVQELLLEYIKTNKLRDPRRKSQIICDPMLKGLFRKQRVGHFEMLKLLESHFLMKEGGHSDEFHGSSVDNGYSPVDEFAIADGSSKTNKDNKRKMRKKRFGRGTQSNTSDYAAIDTHNVSLVFLRRNLMETLLEDVDNFQDKVVGAFVRIRITGSNQIQDMYRLVQIVGTSKAPMPYKVGKRTTDLNLEIQNLNKQEAVSIDIISNQDFTEDECNRLRQSIKCGLIPRLTVGDVLEKAMDLQAARVNDWLETEMVRLSHLCDRASDMGKRKELRDNVEKLQNLKKPEERQRRLEEIPEVHSDPKMDPSYESDEDEEEADGGKQESFLRLRGSGSNRQGVDALSPRKGGSITTDSWSGTKGHSSTSRELGRSLSNKGFSNKGEDTSLTGEITRTLGRTNENELLNTRERQKVPYGSQLGGGNTLMAVASESLSGVVSESHQTTYSSVSSQPVATVNESEKVWHYKDPSGKVQGPFSIVQLRKWNSTGFFPKELTIWKTNEDPDAGILLLDALAGKFHKENKINEYLSNKANILQSEQPSLSHSGRTAAYGSVANSASPSQVSSVVHTKLSVDVTAGANGLGYDSRNESTNLPSPTPNQTMGSVGGEASVNRLSSTSHPVQGSMSSDSNQLYRLPITSSTSNPYQTTYSQQTSSTGYHLQQPVQSAATVNAGAESRISVSSAPSMMQPVASQPSGHNALNNQIPLSSNVYNQWSNPAAASIEKPNQSFSGTPASTTWRPPTLTGNQPGMQQMVLPDQSWRPVAGNPNTGWGVAQANSNVSWTPTGQMAPQMNPNWAIQGMVPVIGNAAAGWVPSGNNMPGGYVAQVNNQVGGIINPGWAGPNLMNTNSNQPWAAAGQSSLPNTATYNNTSNQSSWANGQNANERYSNNRQQGSDGGYQQRGGQARVCEYYLSNRCRKGSACKWLHPQRQ